MKRAHEQGTLVHLSNLDPEYTSGEVEPGQGGPIKENISGLQSSCDGDLVLSCRAMDQMELAAVPDCIETISLTYRIQADTYRESTATDAKFILTSIPPGQGGPIKENISGLQSSCDGDLVLSCRATDQMELAGALLIFSRIGLYWNYIVHVSDSGRYVLGIGRYGREIHSHWYTDEYQTRHSHFSIRTGRYGMYRPIFKTLCSPL
ncbi:hypothetical protein TEA_028963 [Camellia sinensis var. sinensis]|uniref:Uncharacterized protein n=1 Tax=Camellia sinensis var. sinensis TaxID=542762 RepID=A0A4V3WJ04_CAMSN|nr:hypothetical protein TEA_028963 [Camellia sinensis var. sinensis]